MGIRVAVAVLALVAALFIVLPGPRAEAQTPLPTPDPTLYGLILDLGGTGPGRVVDEDFAVTFGKELKRRYRVRRKRLLVPAYYGELVHMESVPSDVNRSWVLWFKDREGVLRSAIVPHELGAFGPLRIETVHTEEMVEYRQE